MLGVSGHAGPADPRGDVAQRGPLGRGARVVRHARRAAGRPLHRGAAQCVGGAQRIDLPEQAAVRDVRADVDLGMLEQIAFESHAGQTHVFELDPAA
jgi:hypothetical protein